MVSAQLLVTATAERGSVPAAWCGSCFPQLWTQPQALCVLCLAASPASALQGRQGVRESIRLALPSKGRMAEDTLMLLKVCQSPLHPVPAHLS